MNDRFDEARRDFLKQATKGIALALSAGAFSASVEANLKNEYAQTASEKTIKTRAKIVILGAGAAGITIANLLSKRLDGANIFIVDPRKRHLYQPGLTLIAAGVQPASYAISSTHDWLPPGIDWIEEAAVNIDPEAKTITTSSSKKLSYDFLILATGMQFDFEAIEGFSLDLVGTQGIGAFYAGPEYAERTWAAMNRFTDDGGSAVFFRPETEIKCAGAPLKYAFLTDDYAVRKGSRGRIEVNYSTPSENLFSVPIVHEKVRMLFDDRGIKIRYGQTMKAIDPGKKQVTFSTADGDVVMPYDFTNVIPPMRAPDVIKNSSLAWQNGPLAADGWAEVDKQTLRHVRYSEIFAIGDIAGVPKGKTAASIKAQAPVVADQIVADLTGTRSMAVYDGYTACPLITQIGRVMLLEFDYKNNLRPSFPKVIEPLEELWTSWLIKEIALKPMYFAMLRGNL